MRRVCALAAAAILGGCGENGADAELAAWRDDDGVLHVAGRDWQTYARALVRDYSGTVSASQRCDGATLERSTAIEVRSG